eukprot:353758-Chlamydomonas_euryale.AAC.6
MDLHMINEGRIAPKAYQSRTQFKGLARFSLSPLAREQTRAHLCHAVPPKLAARSVVWTRPVHVDARHHALQQQGNHRVDSNLRKPHGPGVVFRGNEAGSRQRPAHATCAVAC